MIPEGFGRGLAEAMSRGIPSIVSDIGALPETLGSGGDVVKDYHDSKEWARALVKYKDPEYLAQKSQAALMESKRFSCLRTIDHVAEIIDNLVRKDK
jgi:glycosyltransferase involved in cell wall biosynthesis